MNEIIHTVKSGDTLWGLARKYNVNIDAIRSTNNMSGNVIKVGQQLKIPSSNQKSTSKPPVFNFASTVRRPKNPYLTEENWRKELEKFQYAFEEFHSKAYPDNYQHQKDPTKDPIWTIGSGLTYWLDANGKETKVKKGDIITEKENKIQLERRWKRNEEMIKTHLPNFDKYPPALKFQISDAVFNVGHSGVWPESPNYTAALKRYEETEGWKNKNYPLGDIYQHADWNWKDKKSFIGTRSRMRANPDNINPADYKIVRYTHKRDSIQNAYESRLPFMKKSNK